MKILRYFVNIIIVQLLILSFTSCATSGIVNLTTYKEKEIENDPSKISTLSILIESKDASAGIQELSPDCLCLAKIFIDKEPLGFDGKEPFIGDLPYYVCHPQFINFPTCDSYQQFADPNKKMFYLTPGKHTIYFLFDKWCGKLLTPCNRKSYSKIVSNYHKLKVPINCERGKRSTIYIEKAFGDSREDIKTRTRIYDLKPSYKIIKE